jgi:NDP-sugar pyrophosphorylase family protein
MTLLRATGAAARQVDLSRWPALILAAGLGTRLLPLSRVRAKPALPIAGVPLIARTLRWLRSAGVRRVVINLHSCPSTVTRIAGDGSSFDLEVRYSWETDVLGSAGGPARAMPLLAADRFLIVNGDMITNVDLQSLADRHVETNAMVTMSVIDGLPGYNGVIADDRAIVSGFGQAPGAFHYIGVQAVNAAVFAGLDPGAKSETVHGIYPALIAQRPEAIRIFHSAAEYFDIGSPRDYLETALTIAGRERRPIDRGSDVTVGAGATLTNTITWDRVVIGAGSTLSECIVADDVEVPPAAEFSRCSLVMRDNKAVATPF